MDGGSVHSAKVQYSAGACMVAGGIDGSSAPSSNSLVPSKEWKVFAAVQVAEQERELDDAYDALQVDLRKVPCKNWHKVRPQSPFSAVFKSASSTCITMWDCRCSSQVNQDLRQDASNLSETLHADAFPCLKSIDRLTTASVL